MGWGITGAGYMHIWYIKPFDCRAGIWEYIPIPDAVSGLRKGNDMHDTNDADIKTLRGGTTGDDTMTQHNPAARRLAAVINAIGIAGGLWLLLAVFAAGFHFY